MQILVSDIHFIALVKKSLLNAFIFFIHLQYDCSSADINPIGSVSKVDLRSFLRWGAAHLGYASLADIEAAPPTAELEPIRSNYNQVSWPCIFIVQFSF